MSTGQSSIGRCLVSPSVQLVAPTLIGKNYEPLVLITKTGIKIKSDVQGFYYFKNGTWNQVPGCIYI